VTREGRLLSLYLGLTTSVNGFLQPFVPLYLLEAGLTKGQIGLVAGAGALMAIVLQPILGKLSDRLDARRPFVVAMALCSAGSYLAFPYLHGAWAFLLAAALGANGFMYMQGVGGVLVGRLAAAGKGGETYANYRVWGSIGYVFVALATGLLLNRPGGLPHGRAPFDPLFHLGPLLFFGVAALAYWLPDPKRPPSSDEEPEKVRMSPNLKRFLAVDALYVASLYGASNFISIFMRQVGGTGLLLSCVFIPGVIAEILVLRRSGAFSDRYGRRPVLAVAYLLLPIRLVLYAMAAGPYWVLAVQSLHGFNFGIVGAVAIAFVNDQADHRTRGALQAQLSLVTATAGALGPSLLGSVADRWGLSTMFLVAAAMAALATIIFLVFVDESNTHARGTGIKWLDHAFFKGRDRQTA
jgi:MFS family permease